MSEKKSSASYPPKRTDTLIGPHVRIEGNIDFAGVLRVHGDILGNVSSRSDGRGTMVVDAAGSVIGAVEVPHVVVKGRVRGPALAAQSLEIHAGAHCIGDTSYRTIDVHFGGVIEGLFTPSAGWAVDDSAPEAANPPGDSSAPGEPAAPTGDESPRPVSTGHRRLAWGLLLAIAVVAGLWVNRQPAERLPAAASEAAVAGAPAALPEGGATKDDAAAVTASAAPANADAEIKKVVTVQGLNPAKSADIVFLIAHEPSVLFKKKREDPSAGKQIDLVRGRNVSVAIARNELLRVANGPRLEIFYQGRKVAPDTIESGIWMQFVPLAPGDAANSGEAR